MADHICPWWAAYLFDNPLRNLVQSPKKILGPYVRSGQTCLDLGCGMGWLSLGMARLVGDRGRVVSVDLQPQMIRVLERRAVRRGLLERIDPRVCPDNGLGIDDLAGQVDFAVAFYVLHEVPDPASFLGQVAQTLKPSGLFLLAEPKGHVNETQWSASLALAREQGLVQKETPSLFGSRAALLSPGGEAVA